MQDRDRQPLHPGRVERELGLRQRFREPRDQSNQHDEQRPEPPQPYRPLILGLYGHRLHQPLVGPLQQRHGQPLQRRQAEHLLLDRLRRLPVRREQLHSGTLRAERGRRRCRLHREFTVRMVFALERRLLFPPLRQVLLQVPVQPGTLPPW